MWPISTSPCLRLWCSSARVSWIFSKFAELLILFVLPLVNLLFGESMFFCWDQSHLKQIPGLEVVIVLAIILQFLQKMKQDGMLEEGLYYKFRREVSGARRAAGFCGCLIFPLHIFLDRIIDCCNVVSSQFSISLVSQTLKTIRSWTSPVPRRDHSVV